jgi:hypothetical protein
LVWCEWERVRHQVEDACLFGDVCMKLLGVCVDVNTARRIASQTLEINVIDVSAKIVCLAMMWACVLGEACAT